MKLKFNQDGVEIESNIYGEINRGDIVGVRGEYLEELKQDSKNWKYYQKLLKSHGHEGITALLAAHTTANSQLEQWERVGTTFVQTFESGHLTMPLHALYNDIKPLLAGDSGDE